MRAYNVLLALALAGAVLNVAAVLVVASYWWRDYSYLAEAFGALRRSLPLLIPLAIAWWWRPESRLQWAIVFVAAVAMLAGAGWRYVDIIVIQQDRKATMFLFAGVHLYQWLIAAAGLLLYAVARGIARLRCARTAPSQPASPPEAGEDVHHSTQRAAQT